MEENRDWREELQDIINREMFKEDLMIQIKSLVEQELDRAREEGFREGADIVESDYIRKVKKLEKRLSKLKEVK